MGRKHKKKVEYLGTISGVDTLKDAQEWLGNQRGIVHESKKAYKRKSKHPKRNLWG